MTRPERAPGPDDEAKARFRAALEAKQAKRTTGSDRRGGDAGTAVHDDPAVRSRRQFRRKSG
jgi:hypothetical protein